MSFKAFLKVDGIPETSKLPGHTSEIEVYKFEMSGDGPRDASIIKTWSPATLGQDLKGTRVRFRKEFDSASTVFRTKLNQKGVIPRAVLTVEGSDAGQVTVLTRIEMTNIHVTSTKSFRPDPVVPHRAEFADIAMEEVGFLCGKVTRTSSRPTRSADHWTAG